MLIINEKSIKILQVLATFKFLNTNHFLKLKIANYRSNLHGAIKELIDLNMIGKMSFGVDPKIGKLPNYYYLKRKGKEWLIQNLSYRDKKIKMPIGTSSMFIRDYFHRTNCIDFQIELFLYIAIRLEGEVILYESYYDFSQYNNKGIYYSNTKLIFNDGTYFIPDAIIKLFINGKVKLYSFEMYNGMNTKRVLEQLKKHILSLQQGLLSFLLKEKIGSKVLILFDSKQEFQAVIKRVLEDPSFSEFKNLFLFSYLDLIKSNFNSWYYYDGTKAVF